MQAHEFIVSKQIQWALNHGIQLIGSKDNQGRPAYTQELEQNLFNTLITDIADSFKEGNGGETNGTPEKLPKMQAVHSSSALCVNIFQYWEQIHQVPIIAAACGFCSKENKCSENIIFEKKFSAGFDNHFPPNIDVVIHNNKISKFGYFAIESKFTEAYSPRGHDGLAKAYFDNTRIWGDIPHLHEFAKSISPEDSTFTYLDPAQLVKHILGLKAACGKEEFKLHYLWYDAFGEEGARHREEIERFSEVVKADDIYFLSKTYQELILILAKDYRQEHSTYIQYITDRYL